MKENLELFWRIVPWELFNTLYMVVVSTIFSAFFGIPLGIVLHLTESQSLKPRPRLHQLLSILVNVTRSIPFAILIIAIFPFTRLIVGTSIGTTASIVPLTIAAIPFVARLVENALKGVDLALIDAAQVMGSTTRQIVQKVLVPESLPAIVNGLTLTIINLIGYSAMAGLVGGGGLGKVAIQYGYQRFNGFLMLSTLLLLLLLVEATQWLGSCILKSILRRRGRI